MKYEIIFVTTITLLKSIYSIPNSILNSTVKTHVVCVHTTKYVSTPNQICST